MSDSITDILKEEEQVRLGHLDAANLAHKARHLYKYVKVYKQVISDLNAKGFECTEKSDGLSITKVIHL